MYKGVITGMFGCEFIEHICCQTKPSQTPLGHFMWMVPDLLWTHYVDDSRPPWTHYVVSPRPLGHSVVGPRPPWTHYVVSPRPSWTHYVVSPRPLGHIMWSVLDPLDTVWSVLDSLGHIMWSVLDPLDTLCGQS